MVNEIIREKWFIGAVLLLIIAVGGCVYFYTYTTAQYEKEAAKQAEIVRQKKDMAVGMPYRQRLIYPLVRRGRLLMAQVPLYPEGGLSKKVLVERMERK